MVLFRSSAGAVRRFFFFFSLHRSFVGSRICVRLHFYRRRRRAVVWAEIVSNHCNKNTKYDRFSSSRGPVSSVRCVLFNFSSYYDVNFFFKYSPWKVFYVPCISSRSVPVYFPFVLSTAAPIAHCACTLPPISRNHCENVPADLLNTTHSAAARRLDLTTHTHTRRCSAESIVSCTPFDRFKVVCRTNCLMDHRQTYEVRIYNCYYVIIAIDLPSRFRKCEIIVRIIVFFGI